MFNYSALTDPLLPQDIEVYRRLQPKVGLVWKVIGLVFSIAIGVVLALALLADALLSRNPVTIIIPVVFTFGISMVGLWVWISVRRTVRAMARVYKFAAQNGAAFLLNQFDPPEAGIIFSEGYSKEASSIVDFANGLRVANYEYTTGGGKDSQTHNWSYARMPLERHVPNMVLDAKSNNLFRRISNLPVGYKASQIEKINPELDKLYTLYAPDNYEVDTYYLLTPDVIAALVDAGGRYDIEVVDNTIYFYAQARIDLSKQATWESLLRVVAPVAKEFREQADYYADAKMNVSRSVDAIAPEGRRLRRSVAISTVITIIFAVIYFGFIIISSMR